MRRNRFSKWLNHPVSFLFWFFVGLFVWKINFDPKKNQALQETQMSSISEDVDLSNTNYQQLQSLSDDELLRQLEINAKQPMVEEDYALNPEQIAEVDRSLYNAPEYRDDSFVQISDDTFQIQYEDPKDKSCSTSNRLFYEKQMASNPKMKEMLESRESDDKKFPKKCMLHVMNSKGLPKISLGLCAKSAGGVRVPGAKPCVTENLVNVTYNAYMDVMDCLNLNPKLFFPKIAQESGFLLNAFGAGKDGGIGQFTQPAIEAVNQGYQKYMTEIEKAASVKPSCARIMKHKALLTKAPSSAAQRCSMIAMPENPLRNILYIGIFNRLHMDRFSGMQYIAGFDYIQHDQAMVPVTYDAKDEFEGLTKENKYKQALEDVGIFNPNMHFFKEVLTIAGYNMGSPTALRLFGKYLEKRKIAKKNISYEDFDFNKQRMAKDVYGDGKERSTIEIARSFVMSSFISPKDKEAARAIKLKKRKQLPKEWAASHLKSFPEFLAYNANSYDGKQITRYSVYGTPGYVSFVAEQNRQMRNILNTAGIDPDFCSDPNFLVF